MEMRNHCDGYENDKVLIRLGLTRGGAYLVDIEFKKGPRADDVDEECFDTFEKARAHFMSLVCRHQNRNHRFSEATRP